MDGVSLHNASFLLCLSVWDIIDLIDALFLFEQTAMETGSVTDLRYINNAIGTARKVMEFSTHSSLGGLQATTFAVDMGAHLSNLSTRVSSDMYYAWWVLVALNKALPSWLWLRWNSDPFLCAMNMSRSSIILSRITDEASGQSRSFVRRSRCQEQEVALFLRPPDGVLQEGQQLPTQLPQECASGPSTELWPIQTPGRGTARIQENFTGSTQGA